MPVKGTAAAAIHWVERDGSVTTETTFAQLVDNGDGSHSFVKSGGDGTAYLVKQADGSYVIDQNATSGERARVWGTVATLRTAQ